MRRAQTQVCATWPPVFVSGAYANNWRWCSWPGSGRRRFLRGGGVARRALGMAGGRPRASAAWAATFSRTRSAIRSTSYPLARVRISVSAAHSHSMALSKAVTLLELSRRKLRISVVMLMMPPTQECFVLLGQNHQWNFRTMLAVLRCEFLEERAGSAILPPRCGYCASRGAAAPPRFAGGAVVPFSRLPPVEPFSPTRVLECWMPLVAKL
jgi:hypothetical protein